MSYAGPTYVKSEDPYEFNLACSECFGGGNFSQELRDQATHVVITHSSITDRGDSDWNKFDLYKGEELIASNTVDGY